MLQADNPTSVIVDGILEIALNFELCKETHSVSKNVYTTRSSQSSREPSLADGSPDSVGALLEKVSDIVCLVV